MRQRIRNTSLVFSPTGLPTAAVLVISISFAAGFAAVLLQAAPGASPAAAPCAPAPCVERAEIVARDAALPNDRLAETGNEWGGHQSRVVRTSAGDVFVVYVARTTILRRQEWRVMRRVGAEWRLDGAGLSGGQPPHLLRLPNDQLALAAWPAGRPVLWLGSIGPDSVVWRRVDVPGAWVEDVRPYSAAGVSADGTLCLSQSTSRAGATSPRFIIACRAPAGTWRTAVYDLDARHAYAYLFPTTAGLRLVATRDERWEALGYTKPKDGFPYAFDAIRAWTIDSVAGPPRSMLVNEEAQQKPGQFVLATARDAAVLPDGRLHVLYEAMGPGTPRAWYQMRHAILDRDKVVADGELIHDVHGWTDGFYRIVADARGRSFVLYGRATDVALYPAGGGAALDSTQRTPFAVPLPVNYSGIAVAAPRGGTPWSDLVDAIYPSAESVVYLRIRLH